MVLFLAYSITVSKSIFHPKNRMYIAFFLTLLSILANSLMKIIAVTNQKGGVAKTTSVANLGAALAHRGKKVLLIDLDPQAHLTDGLGVKWDSLAKTVYQVLDGTATIQETMIRRALKNSTQEFSLLPSSLVLSGAEIKLSMIFGREQLLRNALNTLKDFDVVLIDCPPSLGLLTVNALVASTHILIPVEAEYYAKKGIVQTLEAFKEIKKLNPDLKLAGAFITKFDKRRNIHRESEQEIRDFFGEYVLQNMIRVDTVLSEAPQQGLTALEYAPSSRGVTDYELLIDEILGRL